MRIRESIVVSKPLEETFAYVSDFSHAAEWDPGIAESRRLGGGPLEVGTEYDVVALFRGNRVPFRYRTTAFEQDRRVLLEGEGGKAVSTDEITFERAGEGTRIVYDAELRMKGIYRLAEPFLGGTMRSLGAKALAGLKATLDGAR